MSRARLQSPDGPTSRRAKISTLTSRAKWARGGWPVRPLDARRGHQALDHHLRARRLQRVRLVVDLRLPEAAVGARVEEVALGQEVLEGSGRGRLRPAEGLVPSGEDARVSALVALGPEVDPARVHVDLHPRVMVGEEEQRACRGDDERHWRRRG